ncbi:ubiquinone biosynthesis methyltransferase UbiE [Paenibacillus sp. 79R4]|uniref:class I SAM-dependent methyltransferase n=1 Tax=Paenibacillus sp. 79R4 TaxID=2212847 RepID=UPI0015BD5BD2|nr:class I SAM-dependent methyltransferase [Paenibacillus sp. 79R4]NWL90122.1 ubiquinone biosynthesis methyltransferase UbiE [Paenibacillus sp. 79R4]
MSDEAAKRRAVLNHSGVIDARTLADSHRRLAELIRPGMRVLDIGCGTGAITRGIAEITGPEGLVIGIDNDPDWIAKARAEMQGTAGISFEVGDIYDLPLEQQFDIVTSARVLQWLSRPYTAIEQMVKRVRSGGKLLILDYNHHRIEWSPPIPSSMQSFYNAFLSWRSDAGMDNEMADHLAELMERTGELNDIVSLSQLEFTQRQDPDFIHKALIWAEVADFKGKQMVQDGYISEQDRARAERDYRLWVQSQGEYQQMYLQSVEATKI